MKQEGVKNRKYNFFTFQMSAIVYFLKRDNRLITIWYYIKKYIFGINRGLINTVEFALMIILWQNKSDNIIRMITITDNFYLVIFNKCDIIQWLHEMAFTAIVVLLVRHACYLNKSCSLKPKYLLLSIRNYSLMHESLFKI